MRPTEVLPGPMQVDLLVGSLIAIATWPIMTAPGEPGIDQSWIVGLHLAARSGLLFGHDIVFTYGPLGFLGWPQPYIAWTSAAALAFVGTIHLIACIAFLHLARQAVGLPRAAALVVLLAFTFPWTAGWRMVGVLLLIAVVSAVYRRADRPTGLAFAAALGCVVGAAGLGKVNVAIVGVVIGAIGVLWTSRRPAASFTVFGGTVAASLVVLWLASGQQLDDLLTYGRAAMSFSVGYSESMGALDPQTAWTSGVALLATLILVGLIWRRAEQLPRTDRVVVLALFAIAILAEYKAGFTRAGTGVAIYIATLLAFWPVVAVRSRSWSGAATPVLAIVAAFLAVGTFAIGVVVNPIERVAALGDQIATAVNGRTAAAAATADALREAYDLPIEARSLLSGRTVHIEPWEAAVAGAYPEFTWSPLPVFQSYAAFTPDLDQINADRLAGPKGPERILWLTVPGEPLSIDGRRVWFDAPRTKVEMLCRYKPIDSGAAWQVLGRIADRCGAPLVVGTVEVRAGDPVALRTDLLPGIVTVRIRGVADDLASRLLITFDHGPAWQISMGGTPSRIPLGTADGPNVIGATMDSGYIGELGLGPPPATIAVGPVAGAPGLGTPLILEFSVIPLVEGQSIAGLAVREPPGP